MLPNSTAEGLPEASLKLKIKMGTKITYTEAFAELQQIVIDMENSEIGIDELDAKVKRASLLLKICREKLYKTEQNVMETIKTLETG